jgi:hypothetical protein
MKDGKLMVNLINTSGDHTYPVFDEIPSLRNLEVSVSLPEKPGSAFLQPEGNKLRIRYEDGRAVVRIPELKIHAVIEFRL